MFCYLNPQCVLLSPGLSMLFQIASLLSAYHSLRWRQYVLEDTSCKLLLGLDYKVCYSMLVIWRAVWVAPSYKPEGEKLKSFWWINMVSSYRCHFSFTHSTVTWQKADYKIIKALWKHWEQKWNLMESVETVLLNLFLYLIVKPCSEKNLSVRGFWSELWIYYY